jgi:DNA-directed RNA polymerase specialized sigma24 family protein
MTELYTRLEGVLRGFARARSRTGADADNIAAEALRELLTLGRVVQRVRDQRVGEEYDSQFVARLVDRLGQQARERQPDELAEALLRSRELRDLMGEGRRVGLGDVSRGLRDWQERMATLQVRAWLFRAVKSRIIDVAQAPTTREPLPLSDEAVALQPDRGGNDPASDPEDDLYSRQLRAAEECVDQLPDPEQRLFRGALVQSYTELARRLETTENAIGIRLTRLRKALKLCVEGKVRD